MISMKNFTTLVCALLMCVLMQVCPNKAYSFRADGYEWEIISSENHYVRCDGFEWGKTMAIANIPQTVINKNSGVEYTCTYIYSLGHVSELQELSIPATVTDFGDGVFGYNPNLKKVQFPQMMHLEYHSWPSEMFVNCTSLETLVLPMLDHNNGTSIPEYFCRNCKSLKKIVIPFNVTYIYDYAFGKCESLRDFYIYSTVPPRLSEYAFEDLACYGKQAKESKEDVKITLHVPAESIDAYKNSDWSSIFNEIVAAPENPEEAGVEEISMEAVNHDGVSYFTMEGIKVTNPLVGHIYIIMDGSQSKKIIYTGK